MESSTIESVHAQRSTSQKSGRCLIRIPHWRILAVVGLTNLLAAMVFSLPAPFYPKEAESKGLTATAYGFVFGVYQLTQFFASPVVGSNLHRTSPQLVYTLGVLVQGLTVAAFGFLDIVQSRDLFFGLSILLRFLEGLGMSALSTAGSTIVTRHAAASESVAASFAFLELVFGLGFSLGPVLGEALFIVGGFRLPFIVLGGVLAGAGLLLPCFNLDLMKDGAGATGDQEEDGSPNEALELDKKGLLKLLAIPHVVLQLFALLTAIISISFIYTGLEPHLRQFHLTPTFVGLAFFVPGITQAVLAPFVGLAADRIENFTKWLTLTGLALNCMAITFIGPLPLPALQLTPQLAYTFTALFLFGLTTALVYLSTFMEVLKAGQKHGFTNPTGLAAGCWTGAMSLGAFIGPLSAGALVDVFGFQAATYAILGLSLLVLGALLVRSCCISITAKGN